MVQKLVQQSPSKLGHVLIATNSIFGRVRPADQDGRIKLADFGIARVFGMDSMTVDGSWVGTPQYMAPEQAGVDLPITERTDLYSLGCVFYALLAGRPPFLGASAIAVVEAQRSAQPVPVRQLDDSIPVEFESLVMRLLAKNPRTRFGTAYAVERKLIEIEAECKTENSANIASDASAVKEAPTVVDVSPDETPTTASHPTLPVSDAGNELYLDDRNQEPSQQVSGNQGPTRYPALDHKIPRELSCRPALPGSPPGRCRIRPLEYQAACW